METNRVEGKDRSKTTHSGATNLKANSSRNGKERPKKEKLDLDPEEFSLRKRLPARWPCRKTDVYITRKTHFVAQLERCKKLIDAGNEKIYLHGLGAAVSRAVHLALQLQQFYTDLNLDVTTDTVNLTDDIIAETDSHESRYNNRSNSAIHICVTRPNLVAAVKS